MQRTRIIEVDGAQVVLIPEGLAFAEGVSEVEIFRNGEEIVLRPVPRSIGEALRRLPPCPDDLFAEPRDDPPPRERDWS